MFRADVPEAPIDEDRDLTPNEDYVGPHTDTGRQIEPMVLAVTEAKLMQRLAQRDLGFGVRSPVRTHVARAPRVQRRRRPPLPSLSPNGLDTITLRHVYQPPDQSQLCAPREARYRQTHPPAQI